MYQKIKAHLEKIQLGKIDRHQLLVIVAVAAVAVTALLIYHPFGGSADAIAKKAADYLNGNILQSGQVATVTSSSMENGLVHIKMSIGGNPYDMYATTDGKFLFPEAFAITGSKRGTTDTTASTELKKADKTLVEAYVVSDCPFGLQEQRAIVNAVAGIPSLADFVKVRYIGTHKGNEITSMHDSQPYNITTKTGGKEAEENLRQMCIREEQAPKYYTYLGCYMKKSASTLSNGMPIGDSAACLSSTGIDVAKVNSCMGDAKRGLAYADADFALNTKYNIQGSPTVIVNGQEANGSRSADGIRTLVCDSSNTAPSFCSQKLDTTEASTSFSVSYAPANSTTASSNAAACAPAAS